MINKEDHKLKSGDFADRVGTGETPVGITFVRFVLAYNEQGANLDYALRQSGKAN